MADDSRIIFRDAEGNVITEDELRNYSGTVDYEGAYEPEVPEAAKTHFREGRTLGQEGKYNEALEALDKASKLAPEWPAPLYDIAYIYLLAGEFEYALKFYEKTDAVAPKGFFTAKTAVHTLRGEKEGKWPKGLYASYLSLEWEQDPAKKAERVKLLTDRLPGFGPGWKELAALVPGHEQRLAVLERGLQADCDADTRGVLLANKGFTLAQLGRTEEAIEVMGKVAVDPESTLLAAHFARLGLAQISGPQQA